MVLGLFKSKKKKKDKLRIEEIQSSLKKNTRSQGGAGQKRRKLKQELADLQPKEEKTEKKVKRGQGNRNVTGNQNRGGGNKSTSTTTTKSTKSKAGSTRSKMEAKNRSIHGDAKIDALKAKHAAWKEARRRKKTKKSK